MCKSLCVLLKTLFAAKQRDLEDPRARSLVSLINILTECAKKPEYILLENVKGFYHSASHALLHNALHSAQYYVQEFLLTPLDFGIPNQRLRYYLLVCYNSVLHLPHIGHSEHFWLCAQLPNCGSSR